MKRMSVLLVCLLVSVCIGAHSQIQPFQIVSTQQFAVVLAGSAVEDEQLDGAIGEEWEDAFLLEGIELVTYDQSYRFPVSIFVKHDGEFLLIAFRAEIGSHFRNVEAYVAFDSNLDGILFAPGDDLVDVKVAESQGRMLEESLDYAYQRNLEMKLDSQFGGSDDAKAAATLTDGTLVAEFKRPLSSGDEKGNDPALGLVLSPEPSPIAISVGFCGEGSTIEAAIQLKFIAFKQKPKKSYELGIYVPPGYEDVYDVHVYFDRMVASSGGIPGSGWTTTSSSSKVTAKTDKNPISAGQKSGPIFEVELEEPGVPFVFFFTDKNGKAIGVPGFP